MRKKTSSSLIFGFLISLATLFFTSSFVLGQVPTIAAFSPENGPTGTEVIITGTNFDTTPTNNIVFFGATQAAVSIASANELTVTVPDGATYHSITVNSNGLLTSSTTPFNVTHDGTRFFDESSFESKEDFASGTAPEETFIADFDNDGKPDLMVLNSGSNTVSILRNISLANDVNFSELIVFEVGSGANSIAIGDLDGDGKLDLAVTNYNPTNTISILRNTSTGPGNIDFTDLVTYDANKWPWAISLGDLNNNGKLDIILGSGEYEGYSILENLSSVGSIVFSEKIDTYTAFWVDNIRIGDLDGDGRTDFILSHTLIQCCNVFASQSSIFQNTGSSPDSFSFSQGESITGDYYDFTGNEFALGDINTDGKLDFIKINAGDNSLSVLENTSSGEQISFSSSTDLIAVDNPIRVTVSDLNGDSKPDIVTTSSSTFTIFKNTSESSDIISFDDGVQYSSEHLGNNRYMAIGDLDFDGKPDIALTVSGSNSVSIYRNINGIKTGTDVLAFSVNEESLPAVIDLINHTIEFEVEYQTDITSIIPSISLSVGANISPENQVAQDFTNPVTYTVTAEDGTTQDWEAMLLPPSPTGLYAIAKSGEVELKWNSVIDDAFVKYNIYQGTSTNPSTLAGSTTAISDTTFTVTGLTNDTQYFFTVNGEYGAAILSNSSNEDVAVPTIHAGNALSFDLGPRYVDVPITYNSIMPTTYEIWVKPNTPSRIYGVSGSWGINWHTNDLTVLENGTLRYFLWNGDVVYLQSTTSVLDNQWHHVAVVTGTGGTLLYVDGILEASDERIGTTDANGGESLRLGAQSSFPGPMVHYYDGEMDEFRYWTKRLSQEEIIAGMFAPSRGDEEDLALLYHFDETTGSVAFDGTPFGADGTIIGDPIKSVSNAMTSVMALILEFDMVEQTGAATINSVTNSIEVEVEYQTDVSLLIPSISVSAGASISPANQVAQNFTNPVIYTVTAQDGIATQDWTVTVTVGDNEANITSFSFNEQTGEATIDSDNASIYIEVEYQTDITSLIPTIVLSPGANVLPESGIAQDFTSPVNYTVTAEDGILIKDWVVTVTIAPNTETDIIAFAFEEQAGEAIIGGGTIEIEVVYGTDVSTLIPTIVLSPYAITDPASDIGLDFTNPVTYTVTAEDGISTQEWVVTVRIAPNTETDITAFGFEEQTGEAIIGAATINIEVVYGTDVSSLVPTIALSANATLSPESGVAQDFANPVTYTVTAEDGTTTQDWIVNVSVKPPLTATDILDFIFTEQSGPASIDLANHTIEIEVVLGTNITSLIPTIALSPNAMVDPSSDVAQDFSNPLTYTVTAEDGITTQDWVITVTVEPNTETDILSFILAEQTVAASIDEVNHMIAIEVVFETSLTSLPPTITLSAGASVSPNNEVAQDFTSPVTYTVTAEDGTTIQDWIVTVSIEIIQGIGDEIKNARMYPNPSSEELVIDVEEFDFNKTFEVSIVDLLGHNYYSTFRNVGKEIRVDIRKLIPGQYLLSLSQDQNQVIFRFIKE